MHSKTSSLLPLTLLPSSFPRTDGTNIKEFELLVAKDSPTEGFSSIGMFQTQNIRVFNDPYQEFKFRPVTARYLKFKPIANFGSPGYMWLSEFKLYGSLN